MQIFFNMLIFIISHHFMMTNSVFDNYVNIKNINSDIKNYIYMDNKYIDINFKSNEKDKNIVFNNNDKNLKENTIKIINYIIDKDFVNTIIELNKLKQIKDKEEIEIIKQYLLKNINTINLWVLADIDFYLQNYEWSNRWVFMALLSTRVDSAICKNEMVIHLEYSFKEIFIDSINEARRDPQKMHDALLWVEANYLQYIIDKEDSNWLCLKSQNISSINEKSLFWTGYSRKLKIKEAIKKYFYGILPKQ
jgi:hypothetical protein